MQNFRILNLVVRIVTGRLQKFTGVLGFEIETSS